MRYSNLAMNSVNQEDSVRLLLAVLAMGLFGTAVANAAGPTIVTEPQSQSVSAGGTATFTVVATGTGQLSYQWSKNRIAISGALSSSYTTPPVSAADNGASFSVVVREAVGARLSRSSVTPHASEDGIEARVAGGARFPVAGTISTAAILTVLPGSGAPTITLQPQSATVTVGQTAMFTVGASGAATLTYQWSKSGTAISGATASSYTTPATVSTDNGSTFTVKVTNGAGSATSNAATLTVNAAAVAPTIGTQPQNATVTVGQTAKFSVVASGSATLTYQWSNSGTAISGATASSYTTPATVSTDNGSTFTVKVTNTAGSATSNAATLTVNAAAATITSFKASPTAVSPGSSSTLSWVTTGATSIAITPGTFTSTSASGSTSVSPTATTTYTLRATPGSATATATVTVSTGGPLTVTATSCPGGTQNAAYAGCTISATGGSPPYTFSVDTSGSYPPLPEGLALNAGSGAITSSVIGGQGTYMPEIVVKDSAGSQATAQLTFAINGNNAFLANIFSADSIFHHRVDSATTGLPVDASPAGPMYSGYLAEYIRVFFGNTSGAPYPNGIPAIEVPSNQPDVSVSTTMYQSYFTSGPIPAYAPVEGTSYSNGDRHVLVYLEAGGGNPALYEMWQGIYEGGPWTDSSNALWPNANSDALTAQGNGTSDAAGLPVGPLLVNADEVIGTGTPASPNGAVHHPIRFTLNHMVNYWVWPATETAGVGSCKDSKGNSIETGTLLSQSAPPASCSMSGAAGEIYRLKAGTKLPSCVSYSPQAAIIITGFQNYGIILADNGMSGGLIGTPDARWNDDDLSCLTNISLGDFEPVNVSSLMVSNDSGATK